MNTQELIKRIETSFPITPRPSVIGCGAEGTDVEGFFSERAWPNISIHALKHERIGDSTAYLSFMTREGFAYFLPGYMTMCIRDDPREIDFIMLSLYLNLTHPDSPPAEKKGWMYDYQKKKFDGFVKFLSLPQKECVALFLRHQLTHWGEQEVPEDQADPEIKRAYEGYWYQFNPERKEPPLPSPNPQ